MVLLVLVVNSFIIEKLNKLLGESQAKRKDKRDDELESFTKVINSRGFVNEWNIFIIFSLDVILKLDSLAFIIFL